ncbi:MAG: hypothetical protein JW740_00930, partial [Candidatus Zambryskibacteria bacterium]|nr:hypothetical protein [Candidatus Zambryskibacteria bacterium]
MTPQRRYKKASSRISQRNRVRKKIKLFFQIISPLALIIGFILLMRVDFLQIKNFKVVGTEHVKAEDIKV